MRGGIGEEREEMGCCCPGEGREGQRLGKGFVCQGLLPLFPPPYVLLSGNCMGTWRTWEQQGVSTRCSAFPRNLYKKFG